jgi:hypothetical protein
LSTRRFRTTPGRTAFRRRPRGVAELGTHSIHAIMIAARASGAIYFG